MKRPALCLAVTLTLVLAASSQSMADSRTRAVWNDTSVSQRTPDMQKNVAQSLTQEEWESLLSGQGIRSMETLRKLYPSDRFDPNGGSVLSPLSPDDPLSAQMSPGMDWSPTERESKTESSSPFGSSVNLLGGSLPDKKPYDGPVYPPDADKIASVGGDVVGTATVIPGLPYNDVGSTIGFTDDYDEVCPFNTPGSPDVVYSYTPVGDETIEIDLCNSEYDTKVYVYENSVTAGSPYACNDDACGPDGWKSYIGCLKVSGGETYFIVVDGYGGSAGNYTLYVRECEFPCSEWLECDVDAFPEGEPCLPNLPDEGPNDGCNLPIPGYTPIFPGNKFCGKAWLNETGRDTDWYLSTLLEGDSATWCVTANFRFQVFILDLTGGCPIDGTHILASGTGDPCDTVYVGITIPLSGDYVFFVAPQFGGNAFSCADGWAYQAQLFVEECELDCDPEAVHENEPCDDGTVDYTNGGCNYAPEVYDPILPGMTVCGTGGWRDSLGTRDTDWYLLPYDLVEGDSVTWCVTADFPFSPLIIDLRYGCGTAAVQASGVGDRCDTTYVGWRVDSTGTYAFFVAIDPTGFPGYCANGPWTYQATLYLDFANPTCYVGGCGGLISEGEVCDDVNPDVFNGGCFAASPNFSPISSGDDICGTSWQTSTDSDADWYRKSMTAGEEAAWCVRAAYPCVVAIVDISAGCGPYVPLALDIGNACEVVTARARATSSSTWAFVTLPLTGPILPCVNGPWEYEAWLNPVSYCDWPGCHPLDVPESEPCIEDDDVINGGCNYMPNVFSPIDPGAKVCGEVYWDFSFRDTDWYLYHLVDGDTVTWCVTANFPFIAYILDLGGTCTVNVIAGTSYSPCDTAYVGWRVSGTADYAFWVAPVFGASPLYCGKGPWEYEAVLDYNEKCLCDCPSDPICDGVYSDIFDLSTVVEVAFRSGSPVIDPTGYCPFDNTDVNCSGATDIVDAVSVADVAFRQGVPGIVYCNPCYAASHPPGPSSTSTESLPIGKNDID